MSLPGVGTSKILKECRNMLSKPLTGLEEAREQVDRILASDTFRTSDALRRLLRFIADKTFSGEANQLKEYSVGLDALGKPPTYDTRQDGAARIQASRLRLKLAEYYRSEGSEDPLTIEMPRGRFKIVWTPRGVDSLAVPAVSLVSMTASVSLPSVTPSVPAPTSVGVDSHNLERWQKLTIGLAAISLLLALLLVLTNTRSVFRASRTIAVNPSIPGSTPELDALWSPLLGSAHHLIVAFSNPLFVRFLRNGNPDIVYRRREMTGWNSVVASPEFPALSRSLGNPSAKPSFNFVERSNLVATFVLGQFFARRRDEVSLVRLDDLSWQQFAENDIVLLATPAELAERQAAMPVDLAFITEKEGIRNLRPVAGEPPIYADSPDHQESDGEGLELISMLPGPLGRTRVLSFSSNRAWGVISGVQALTDPAFVQAVTKKLRETSGEISSYYQIVIKIRYRDGTPTNASYLTHRALTLTTTPDPARSGPPNTNKGRIER
jgi:hypothetical protein